MIYWYSKRIIIAVFLLFFSLSLINAQSGTLGDTNSDGSIDIVDALLVSQYYVGLNPNNFNSNVADVNSDQSIDVIDALLIAQFYVGLISVFPGVIVNPDTPWDWAGVVATGQSLAVGEQGKPVQSVSQPYNNLKLSTGSLSWPVDPNSGTLSMVPLVEPVGRLAPNYPSSWPENMAGETPATSMASQVTSMYRSAAGKDYICVHGNVGENGQCLKYLVKNAPRDGLNGRAYEATLIETRAITRLAQGAGKTYGVAAVIVTHGECDSGNTNYENELYQLWSDYNNDLKAITGQTQDLIMIVSQQNSQGDNSSSTLAVWKAGVDHPESFVCSGPKYQFPYASDGVHLTTEGYRRLGEKYGQIYYERVILGNNWQPLQPTGASRSGRVITVNFHVPSGALAWENTFQTPHQDINEWRNGKGFEVRSRNSSRLTISSVQISGNSVQITCTADLPADGVIVSYAMISNSGTMTSPYQGTRYWGQLRDSDSFIGISTGKNLPNYCVAFELIVP
ncbi:MAG: dockerin type I repeat-containing protein [Spirochaetales bacterium]|nr:dockerin type I repeat-containing protein [Spirochaetales bacterium]